jgi:hypothetical protein
MMGMVTATANLELVLQTNSLIFGAAERTEPGCKLRKLGAGGNNQQLLSSEELQGSFT